jgi:hypothetical protein
MKPAVNFKDVFDAVASFEPATVSDPVPIAVEQEDKVTDTMQKMIAAVETRDVDPEDCVFYHHPTTVAALEAEIPLTPIRDEPMTCFGHRLIASRSMPSGQLLFCPPDAISLDATVLEPLAVVYTED